MKKITAMIMALTMAFTMASCSGSASSGTTSGEDGSAAQVDSSQTGQTSMEFDENATEDPQVSDVEILNKADKYLKGVVTIPQWQNTKRVSIPKASVTDGSQPPSVPGSLCRP